MMRAQQINADGDNSANNPPHDAQRELLRGRGCGKWSSAATARPTGPRPRSRRARLNTKE
jgi:hypothetical protein